MSKYYIMQVLLQHLTNKQTYLATGNILNVLLNRREAR